MKLVKTFTIRGYTLKIAVFLLLCSSFAFSADWPTYNADNCRSGISAENLKMPLRQVWVHNATNPPAPAWPGPAKSDFAHSIWKLSPTMVYDRAYHTVIADGFLYYGSSADDSVICIDIETGNVKWKFITEGPIRISPTINRGKVYFGSDDGYVYCLDSQKGRLIWKFTAGPEDKRIAGNERVISLWSVRSGPAIKNGVVYFTAGIFPMKGVYLCALNAANGSEIWKEKIDISAQGNLVISPGRIFVPTGRTAPKIYNRQTGKVLSKLQGGGCFAVLRDDLYINSGGEKGGLVFTDLQSPEKIIFSEGLDIIVCDGVVYILKEGSLSCLERQRYIKVGYEITKIEKIKKEKRTDEQNKNLAELKQQKKQCLKWQVKCPAAYSLILAGDTIFAGGDGSVFAYNIADGKQIWTEKLEGKVYSLAVSKERLFASTDKGLIYCFANDLPPVNVKTNKPTTKPYPKDSLTSVYRLAAKKIINSINFNKGYCFVLDCGSGRLAYELAKLSDMQIIGIEKDPEKASAARKLLMKTGLYGQQITIHNIKENKLPYPDYFANLIVSDKMVAAGKTPEIPVSEIGRLLRPCGGMVIMGPAENKDLKKWGNTLPNWYVTKKGNSSLGIARRDELKGAGEWTHTYAEPGNTACSGDTLITSPTEIQWFGRPGPRKMIDRHNRNVPPLYKNGQLFIPGNYIVYAVDAYNGTMQWQVEIPNSRRVGVFLDSSNMVVDDKNLYIAAKDKCHRLNVKTGEANSTYNMPQLFAGHKRQWGYLAYFGDMLFGSGCKPHASHTMKHPETNSPLFYRNMKVVTSDYLFSMERKTGKLIWKYKNAVIVNPTIAVGDGKIFFIETTSPKAIADELGRMPVKDLFDGGKQYLVALEQQTGKVKYKKEIDTSKIKEPVYLNYSDGIVLFSGSNLLDNAVTYYYYSFSSDTGEIIWQTSHATSLPPDGCHGEYNRHPTIADNTIYAWPYAYELKTGKQIESWKFDRRGHGCGGVSASATCLFWRGFQPWMYDTAPNGGPYKLTHVTRPGCWINIIPAGGMILIPEASSGCTCAYSIQTSIALRPSKTY
ncbi:MAG: PQQ-binding-like beta-propeller repeat protein [Planctomycetes bacterium]|nr:PQQ-binding-like beta-propeller repeat protein [Planctomycetota bacterium]